MGSCGSRDGVPSIDGAHDAENFCYAADCGIKLRSVEFRAYQAAIKRFGYRINMEMEHLKWIAPEINLDLDKMQHDPESAYAIVYHDKDFAFKHEKYNIEALNLIGWLWCRHWSDETQALELWHIVNPTLEEVATKEQVLDIATRLVYIAVTLNLKLIQSKPATTEQKEALEYHKRIAAGRRSFLQRLTEELPEEVTKDELCGALDQFFRSYDLRLTLAGDKKEPTPIE